MADSCERAEVSHTLTADSFLQNDADTSGFDEEPNSASKCLKEASTIQAIDKASVHRICSGQVVLTLATAVKELLENSVDAGATNVDVRLKEYGTESIEVTDNGSGVNQKDFEGLTLKHHTSKLEDFEDLVNVTSFGFRGEALSSLCALSNMTITTRHKSADVGTRLEFDLNGKIVARKSAPRQVGTTVQVQNVFHSLPVRHKEFHRNVKKEFARLVHVLNAYCLISTRVRISCTNQTAKGSRSIVMSTNGNDSMKENIANIFSPKQLQSLLEFQHAQADDDLCNDFGIKPNQRSAVSFRIEGFVSKCEHGQGRSSTDRQFIFINQRPCDHAKILKLMNEVYHSYNRHQNPFIALSIFVDKGSVDVNVTPDKRQIFLEGENLLLATLKTSLVQMFEPTASIYKVNSLVLPRPLGPRSHKVTAEDTLNAQEYSELQGPGSASLSSSLSKLKRSFSSAFARNESSDTTDSCSSDMKAKPSFAVSGPCRNSNSCPVSSDRGSITQFFKLSPRKSSMSTLSCVPTQADADSRPDHIRVTSESYVGPDIFTHHEDVLKQSNLSGDSVADQSTTISNGQSRSFSGDNFIQDGGEQCTSDMAVLSDYQSDTLNNLSFIGDNGGGDGDVEKKTKQNNYQPSGLSVHYQCVPDRGFGNTLPASDCLNVETAVGDDDVNLDRRKESQRNQIHKMDEDGHFVTDLDLCQEGCDETSRREQHVAFCLSSLRKQIHLNVTSQGSTSQLSRSFRATICPTDNRTAEDELQKEISKDMFEKMDIIGQFNLGFIITKLGQDLFIVDQHATDEKYNFEMLQRDTVLQSQKLIIPQNLELTATNETILIDNLEVFKKNGFDFLIDTEALPTQRVKLVSAPVSRNWSFGKDDIEELLFMLSDSPNVMCWPSRVRMMFASRACRKSVMIGTALNKYEMKKYINHMGQIEQPWNCPHGRPTMRHLFNLDMLPSSSTR